MSYHHKLRESDEDQLCLAAVHYLRGHYDDCIEIYKRLLQENKSKHSLYVYLALCYYQQEQYEMSLETIQIYLNQFPQSPYAINIKACNKFMISSSKEADEEQQKLQKAYEGGSLFDDNDLLRHNRCVFSDGESALKIFPPLMDLYPEAKLNLIIFYL